MRIERIWAMPNKWTFTILPIAALLKEEVDPTKNWADPFAGENSPASLTNDLNPERPTTHHLDALDFLKTIPDETCDGVLFDPPYSITQLKECYEGVGRAFTADKASMGYWKALKDEIGRITIAGGKVICFGWNTMGLGKGRGFDMRRVLIVPHGGSKNDTLVTVETKSSPPNSK